MYPIFFNFRAKRFFLSKKKKKNQHPVTIQVTPWWPRQPRDDPGNPVAAPMTPWQPHGDPANPMATLLIFFTKKETVVDGVPDYFVFSICARYQLWSESLSLFLWEMNMKV